MNLMTKENEIKKNSFLSMISPSYTSIFLDLESCIKDFNQAVSAHHEVSIKLTEKENRIATLEKMLNDQELLLLDKKNDVATLTVELKALTDGYINLMKKAEAYDSKIEQIQNTLREVQSRYELIVKSLTAETIETERYRKYRTILNKQFMPFTSSVTVLKNEGEIVFKLKAIEDQLALIESLYHFKNKSVVAVSGGFSSGKSSFISSLFSSAEIQLPIGVEPITAIPTYVCHAEERKIAGYNEKGGVVEISTELYSQLSHKFVQGFGFNLKELLPFIALETPMDNYHNISFIDLPGYNPGDRGGVTDDDIDIASEYMQQANAIIWVIGLDANGTISRADIDFLYDNITDDMKLYVVLNKADLKPRSDIEEIIESVVEMLELDDINFEGISAYSSEMQKEIEFYNKSISEFLTECDVSVDSYKNIRSELHAIFRDYKNAFIESIEKTKLQRSILTSLELDLHEIGAFDIEETEEINTGKYKSRKTKSNLEANRREQLSPFVGILGTLLGNDGIKSSLYDENSNTTLDSDQEIEKHDVKLDKINSIRTCITDMKLQYDVKKIESKFEQLKEIEKLLLALF